MRTSTTGPKTTLGGPAICRSMLGRRAAAADWAAESTRSGTAIARCLSVSDARVEQGVGQVDQQIDQHIEEREDQDHRLDGRKVAAEHGVHGQPAEPGAIGRASCRERVWQYV